MLNTEQKKQRQVNRECSDRRGARAGINESRNKGDEIQDCQKKNEIADCGEGECGDAFRSPSYRAIGSRAYVTGAPVSG